MFYVGIDIAKQNHEASIIDSSGKLLDKSISFSNSQVGCDKLITLLERFEADTSNTVDKIQVVPGAFLFLPLKNS